MLSTSPGSQTSEFKQARHSAYWSSAALILGGLVSAGSAVAHSVGSESTLGIVLGAVVAIAAIVQRTLTDLGYIKSRTDVKTAALLAQPKTGDAQ